MRSKNRSRKMCDHGKRQESCKECGGKQICKHERQRSTCIECGGGSVCKCERQKSSCRKCDPLNWAKRCIWASKGNARKRSYQPPDITPEDFLILANKTKFCVACGSELNWDKKFNSHLHHSHTTGQVFGFCHQLCNQAEGMLSKMTSVERFNFVKFFFPEVFK